MFQSRELFPDSDYALLANRVVLVLDKIRKDQEAPEKTEALGEAVKFLKFVLEGKDLTDRREIQANSYVAALAYGEAVKAVERLPERKDEGDSENILRSLLSSASALRADERLDGSQLNALSSFFRLVRDLTSTSSGRRIEVLRFFE